eukprot:INCI14787.1.p1 GENE.INCI14787.1~~INCI14787.1.p1  ORF type:complete len:1005 (-),score=129.93 INCI14787.1:3-3017(-)
MNGVCFVVVAAICLFWAMTVLCSTFASTNTFESMDQLCQYVHENCRNRPLWQCRLHKCTDQSALRLVGRNLTGTIPPHSDLFKRSRRRNVGWRFLDLSQNQLSGTIPDFDGGGSWIQIHLGGNQLTGTLPKFGEVYAFSQLHVAGNMLSGTIPVASLGAAMAQLDITDNSFSGSIPSALFEVLPKLHLFHGCNNKLTGKIPQTLRDASLLNSVKLSRNRLHGTLPSIEGLMTLRELDLSSNQITGAPVPPGLVTVLQSRHGSPPNIFLQNNAFNGHLDEKICDVFASLSGSGSESTFQFHSSHSNFRCKVVPLGCAGAIEESNAIGCRNIIKEFGLENHGQILSLLGLRTVADFVLADTQRVKSILQSSTELLDKFVALRAAARAGNDSVLVSKVLRIRGPYYGIGHGVGRWAQALLSVGYRSVNDLRWIAQKHHPANLIGLDTFTPSAEVVAKLRVDLMQDDGGLSTFDNELLLHISEEQERHRASNFSNYTYPWALPAFQRFVRLQVLAHFLAYYKKCTSANTMLANAERLLDIVEQGLHVSNQTLVDFETNATLNNGFAGTFWGTTENKARTYAWMSRLPQRIFEEFGETCGSSKVWFGALINYRLDPYAISLLPNGTVSRQPISVNQTNTRANTFADICDVDEDGTWTKRECEDLEWAPLKAAENPHSWLGANSVASSAVAAALLVIAMTAWLWTSPPGRRPGDGNLTWDRTSEGLPADVLGKGAEGIVFKGQFCGTAVAVKRVTESLDKTEEAMLVALSHPNIVSFLGVHYLHGFTHIILQLCDRATLDDVIDDGVLTDSRKRRICAEICAAMKYLHANDVVHRDLKPTNVLFLQGHVKLSDFGLARKLSGSKTRHVVTGAGTEGFMAPEVIDGQGTAALYQKSADCFSLGVLLHIVLTRIHPFGHKLSSRTHRISQGDIWLDRSLNFHAKRAIEALCHHNVKRRLPDAERLELVCVLSFLGPPSHGQATASVCTARTQRIRFLICLRVEWNAGTSRVC